MRIVVSVKMGVSAGAQGPNFPGSSAICCLVSGEVFYCSSASRWFAAQDLQHSVINGKIAHFMRWPAYSSQLCTAIPPESAAKSTAGCMDEGSAGEDFI